MELSAQKSKKTVGYQVSWAYQLVWGCVGFSFEVYCLLVLVWIGFEECL